MKRASRMKTSAAPTRDALRSRGCPNPDYMIVRKSRARVIGEQTRAEQEDYAAKLRRAEHKMHGRIEEVKRRKAAGLDYRGAAAEARAARHAWLELKGGLDVRQVSADQGSAVNPLIAV